MDELLRTHGADPVAIIRRKVVYRFHARVAPRWSFGRVFLAGDAAHLTPPFAGQGMNSGIRDAQNLAWKLKAVLDDRAGPGLLATYEQERKDHIWQMVHLALRMGRVMSPPSWWEGVLTQAGFLALKAWPPARDYVAQMKYKPPPRFNTGFLLPDGKGRASLVGRLLPQPMVRADKRDCLLDELIGLRFALMMRGEKAPAALAGLHAPIWDELGVVRVAVLAAGTRLREPTPDNVVVVTEVSDELAQAASLYDNHALFIRPDRYVAAAVPMNDPKAAERTVAVLVASTRDAGNTVRRPFELQPA